MILQRTRQTTATTAGRRASKGKRRATIAVQTNVDEVGTSSSAGRVAKKARGGRAGRSARGVGAEETARGVGPEAARRGAGEGGRIVEGYPLWQLLFGHDGARNAIPDLNEEIPMTQNAPRTP